MTAQMPRLVITAIDVAGLMGWKCAESFYKNHATLRAAGFPEKLPGRNGWSLAAVKRWIDSNGGRDQLPEQDNMPPPANDAGGGLEGRYAR